MNSLAMSEVISTLVLTSTVLLITIVAAFIADSVLETQAQKSEFEEAKSAFTLLADIIEDISSNPYASGYVRVNSRSGRIEYKNCTFTITVSVDGNVLTSNTTSSVMFIGGDKIGFIPSEILYGVSSILVNDSITPLVSVYTGYANGRPFVALNTTRVRIVDRGTIHIRADNTYYHVFDVILVRLVITRVQVSGSFTILVHNVWTNATVIPIPLNEGGINARFTITVKVISDGSSKKEDMNVDLSNENIDGVLFNVITVELDLEII